MLLIPKIIHQIWIGPDDIPEHINSYRQSVKEKFSDYTYSFWTNDNLPKLPKNCQTQFDRYKKLGRPAFQADILRYFLLNEYGGIYLDVDFLCNKNFENLITKSFFCVSPNNNGFHVCNGVFACIPNNPILTDLLDELTTEPYHGPALFTKYISKFLGVPFRTHIYKYLAEHPHEYIECGEPADFFKKNGYCWHNALRSWLPKRTK
jgi:mannosyltransferase OCH1-like enzyme